MLDINFRVDLAGNISFDDLEVEIVLLIESNVRVAHKVDSVNASADIFRGVER